MGIPLSDYIEALAEAGDGLGGWFRFRSTAAATGDDAARTVIVADLVDDADGGTLYEGGWLYARDGNVARQQRRVSVFDGSTGGVARFVCAGPFSATPNSNINWEYSAKLPRIQHGQTPGLREIVNQALRKLWIEDRYTFTGNGTYAYAVPAWLTRAAQIGEVYDTTVASLNPYRLEKPKLRLDAEAPYLELGTMYSASQTFDVKLWIEGNRRLKIDGTWAYQTSLRAGLVNDDDEALVPLDDFLPVALAMAYSALAWPHPGTRLDYWAEKAEAQKVLAGAVKALSLPTDISGGRLSLSGSTTRWAGYWP